MKAKKFLPSLQLLNHLFLYDKSNGLLFWRNPRRKTLKGKEAGAKNSNGYKAVNIDGSCFQTHRVIWFLETGKWPENLIDHIDGDKQNNKISNLRECTQRQNQMNRKSHREGKLVGTFKYDWTDKWQSLASINGKKVRFGYFNTEKEAHEKYISEMKKRKLI